MEEFAEFPDPDDIKAFKDDSDLFDKVEEESSAIGRLLSKIPGFGGYIERSRRREADQMLREGIAAQLEATRVRLGRVQEELARDIIKAIEYAEQLGRVDVRLAGLAGKVHDAPTGYSGFFDAVKIDEEDLARIYDFDETMMGHADAIDTAVENLATAVLNDEGINAALRALQTAGDEANSAFDARRDVLAGIA